MHGKIAEIIGCPEGTTIVSPSRFVDWNSEADYEKFVAEVRNLSGGIPVGIKMSAQHLELDLDAALRIGVDYIILDGRGGGTAAAPVLFRDHIGVPTIPALVRARDHLDKRGRADVSLIVTGGLRSAADFIKALALGADAIAIGTAAIQAIGCRGIRLCHTDMCPVGIATQNAELRARLKVDEAGKRLSRYLESSVTLMQIMARACGHRHLRDFSRRDLTTWQKDMAELARVSYAGSSCENI